MVGTNHPRFLNIPKAGRLQGLRLKYFAFTAVMVSSPALALLILHHLLHTGLLNFKEERPLYV